MKSNVTTLAGEAAISSFRTTRQIYRDLMRMTKHAGHYNGNEQALQQSIRSQFKANMLETDEKRIAQMKSEAIRALSNYFVYQAKLMVGTEAPKSIFDGDDDEEAEVDRTSFLQAKRSASTVPDAEVSTPPKKRLTAAERRRNVARTQQQLAAKRKRFLDGFNSFAAKQREAMEQFKREQQEQEEQEHQQADEHSVEKKETGGVM